MSNLLYIDDSIDPILDKYLDTIGKSFLEASPKYQSMVFNPSFSYLNLLENTIVQESDIILIDSRLFANDRVQVKFSGEEVSILFRKYFPFKETIIISQNELGDDYRFIKKYTDQPDHDYVSYYNEKLSPILTEAQERVRQYSLFLSKLENNTVWDDYLKSKLINSVNGVLEYDGLKKSDIDKVIAAFKALERHINV